MKTFRHLRFGAEFTFPGNSSLVLRKVDKNHYRYAGFGKKGHGRPFRQDDLDKSVNPVRNER